MSCVYKSVELTIKELCCFNKNTSVYQLEKKNETEENITKTCPCNVYPLEPHFYMAKLNAGTYLFFLCLLQNIECGYLLEMPRQCGSIIPTTIYVLSKNKENINNFELNIFSSILKLKNICLLHGQVFEMSLHIFCPRLVNIFPSDLLSHDVCTAVSNFIR